MALTARQRGHTAELGSRARASGQGPQTGPRLPAAPPDPPPRPGPGAACSMSSTLFPAGLVPFEELFSKPPNPMLGPSLTQDRRALDPGPPPSPCREPPSPPPPEPAPARTPSEDPAGPDDPRAADRLPSGDSPRWDFGDLFCKPPNPMLSSSTAPSGTVALEPPAPPSPESTSSQDGGQAPEAASPEQAPSSPGPGEARPRNWNDRGRGPRPEGKSRKGAGAAAAKGTRPQEEDFAQLLEQYKRERETPKAEPGPPPPEGKAKKAKRSPGAGGAARAKKKKRARPTKSAGPRPPARPPAAPARPPVSQEFVQKNTVALGSQRVCKYFLAGRCVRGDQCRLDHAAEGLKFQQLCKFYVQGYCTRGEHCRFLHNEFPCKFFHTGAKCYQGDHCSFSHAPLTPETEGLLRAALAGPAPAEAAPAPS